MQQLHSFLFPGSTQKYLTGRKLGAIMFLTISQGKMHLSRNQYIRKYQQRIAGWCKAIGKAVSNSFCEQCTELGIRF